MIRRLQRRLIALVLAGLLIASAGLVLAINVMNMRSLRAQAYAVLDMLAENGGQRPVIQRELAGFDPAATPPGREEAPGETPPPKPEGKQTPMEDGPLGPRGASTRNAANLSTYYLVHLNADGSVSSWESERKELYSDAEISQMAAAVQQRGGANGRIGNQFYRRSSDLLIVVDATLEIQNAKEVLRLTALVALIQAAVLGIGAVLLIRRMVRPVDEAMEKQKQFVWDASHELKTPLAVISANAEVLAGEIGENQSLQYIQSEVQRTDQLVQNLLTLARMEKGTVQARHRKFDLSRALLSVALPFETAVFEAGKEMDIRVPDGAFCVGDEEMIKQLVMILLSNAAKYSDAGGRITLSLETKGDKRMIRVHNTGPAIPPEAQEKIFDRFYRVDSSHNRETPGNGLGLAIARSIVEAHKGRITVQSEQDSGTAFTVVL